MKSYHVYMLANWTNAALYIGITGNLEQRIAEHKHGQIKGFTQKYNLKKLVYVEEFTDVKDAITREKQLKNWSRSKKNMLIETTNPEWIDLTDG